MPDVISYGRVERSPAAISELARLFDRYRTHYGHTADPAATNAWIHQTAGSGELIYYCALHDGTMVGFAAVHQMPASLRLGRFWQLRDLFVGPDSRRQGIARRLVEIVRRAAVDAGAQRLSLQTEESNSGALAFYRHCGFTLHADLLTLSIDLPSESRSGR